MTKTQVSPIDNLRTICRATVLVAAILRFSSASSDGQTAFFDFNTPSQYANNFNAWEDVGGANGQNYSFAADPAAGVDGSGGVSVTANSDTTAVYKGGSWNLSTNNAAIIVSVLVQANGQASMDKVQLGVMNSNTNGLNSNAGVEFESYRFIPDSATDWGVYEQYRFGNATTTPGAMGTVSVIAGHWYKFVVGVTNTSGISGNYSSGCALYDYGTDGLTPGPNVITFSTANNQSGPSIATNSTVWPALRAFQDGGISAWDNFLVFTPASAPVFTLTLNNTTVAISNSATFDVLADGPGPITYSWFTNGAQVPGATDSSYTTPLLPLSFSNVMAVAHNTHGSATNQAVITVTTNMLPIALTGFNRDVVIESNIPAPPYTSYAQEFNPGEGTAFYQHGLPGTTYGLPASGIFNSVIDGTVFQFQPYTANNALVMSGETGINSGTLSLAVPATYRRLAILANSGSASSASTGTVTLQFADGTSYSTTYDAADWFFNPGFALQGVDRIDLNGDGTDGGPTDPRFYQTTLDLTQLLGATNKPIIGLTFGEAIGVGATGVYAVSGLPAPQTNSPFTLATLTNLPASGVASTSATLNGEVLSIGGYAPTVTIFYGQTNGGTNAGNWANNVNLGVATAGFATTVQGLLADTTYYYTAMASNYAGISWASPSSTVTTAPVTPPEVTNAPATGIAATYATLNGQVLSTGGGIADVILFYGTSDGMTNAANWAYNVPLGSQSGDYSQTVSELSSNTTYYFTAEISNALGARWAVPSLYFTTTASNPVSTGTAVLTYHNDNTRMGVNSNETILTLQNVNTNTFGRLFTYAVDGFVYAEPLIMTNVVIPGKGTHNVVYVATEHNSIYAFDADNNSGANAAPLWQTSFLGPGVTTVPYSDLGTLDITPEIGITSTPVIDPVTGTIYAEVKTLEQGTTYVHRLHALDITTGIERTNFNSPVVISCTNYPGFGSGDNDGKSPPHVLWNPLREHSRPALTLLNGSIYMSFASHGDNGPYHGWVFGYSASNLAQAPSVYNSTPNGSAGGFWDGGGGPSVDSQGNLYLQTGNGTFDGGTTLSTASDYAMSVVKLATTNGLTMVDYFAPSNAVSLSDGDQDLGSSAPMILPDSAGSTAHPHLVVGGGKTQPIYLIDRDNMGRFNGVGGNNKVVQQFNGSLNGDRDTTPAFYNNTLYVYDFNSRIGAFTINNGLFNTTPVETPDYYANKGGATACISANGNSNAIMWAIYNTGGESPTSPCVLRAYDATNLTKELYASDQLGSRDAAGDAVKFTAPTIANGKVYVGAQYTLTVYGLAQHFLNTPVITPDGGVFTNSVTVHISDSSLGTTIYYTLDGTTPTTNSTLYTGPFVLDNSAAVTAGAFEAGAVPSGTASASFLDSSAIGNGTGLKGQYWANTTSSAFLAPGFNALPTLTRIDPTVNFDWSTTPPATNVGPTVYVVRWTGTVEPQFNETYTFWTDTDDGVLLWVNGQLLVNEWMDQGATTWSGSIPLLAQQRYNIEMDYYQNGGGAQAQLFWSSPSTGPMTIIPESQLYPVINTPPSVTLTTPTNGASLTAAATVTLGATAAAQLNAISYVAFYINGQLIGTATNLPYALTETGLPAGGYTLKAVAADTTGLSATSAPISITVNAPSGLPYGLTNVSSAPAFYNMPPVFTGQLPARLSLTGVFSDTPDMVPVSSLIPYSPNVPLWSDGAQKVRYFSVPNTGAPYTSARQIAFAPTGTWSFPSGTVFVKTFELQTNQSDPTSLRRLETRLLVRDTNGAVYGVTYKWRSDYSDADLLSTNLTEAIPIVTPGGVVTQDWYYPSPSDCLQCHTLAANYVLGVNARQLNGNMTYSNGVTDNQLRSLNRAGLFYPAIDESQIPGIEQLFSVTNSAASYVQRARSYLDANCAQCHQPGGPGPTFDARYDTPLANQNMINVPVVKGNLGYDNVNIVTPNDVWRSSLYDRMNIVNPSTQMPTLARNVIDTNAVQLMANWINNMGSTPALPPPTITPVGGTFLGYVNVTIQPPTNNVTMYYTLDGSLPTTNSQRYTGPFTLTNNATVSANAWETGYIDSVVGTGQYTVLQGIFFMSPGGFTNGTFQMSFAGPTGSNYVLQVSTNLTQWTSISTNTPTTSPFLLSDPTPAGGTARFYRVLQSP